MFDMKWFSYFLISGILIKEVALTSNLIRRGEGKEEGQTSKQSQTHQISNNQNPENQSNSPTERYLHFEGTSVTLNVPRFRSEEIRKESREVENKINSKNQLKGSIHLDVPSHKESEHYHPRITVDAGKKSGIFVINFLSANSPPISPNSNKGPRSPSPPRNERKRSRSLSPIHDHTMNLIGKMSDQENQNNSPRNEYKRTKDKYPNVDLSLNVGQSSTSPSKTYKDHSSGSSGETRRRMNLFKRGDNLNNQNSIKKKMEKNLKEPKIDFHSYENEELTNHFERIIKDEGKKWRGTLHVGIQGDPNAKQDLPKIEHYRSQHPTTHIHSFFSKPNSSGAGENGHNTQPIVESEEEKRKRIASSLTLYGAKHTTPIASETDDLERKFRHSTRVGYLHDNFSKELIKTQKDKLNQLGSRYELVTIEDVKPHPKGFHQPQIGIVPGKQDVNLISNYYKADSPERTRSTSNSPSKERSKSPPQRAQQNQDELQKFAEKMNKTHLNAETSRKNSSNRPKNDR